MLFLGGLILAAVASAVWVKWGDADWTTLFVHRFLKFRRESFRGKVVWITGASSGIGKEIALILAKLDCRLVISGTREKELEDVRKTCELRSEACEVLVICGDIADTSKHAGWVAAVLERFGEIHYLVNNAGRSQRSEFSKVPEKIERELLDINTFAVMSLSRLVVAEWLKDRKGDRGILVTSSTAGKLGAPFSATYCASKHALHGFFESLRSELCVMEYPIRITLACPGPVRSNIRVTAYTDKVGQQYNQPDTDEQKLLDTRRCAELMISAFACGLDESWIAHQPILLLYYVSQYLPSIFRLWLLPLVMNKGVQRLRDGR